MSTKHSEIARGRLIAIGDIHGCLQELDSLLDQLAITPMDTLVCLGDCVNRGPDTRGVLDRLIELEQRCRLICILGNHEEVMLDARHDRHAYGRWMFQGGEETLQGYGTRGSIVDVPSAHWEFLERFVPYYETEGFIFVHANYVWRLPMQKQPVSMLRWTSIDDAPPYPHISGKRVILGHQPGTVRDGGHYLCIDTGCGFGGKLTAVELLTQNKEPFVNTPFFSNLFISRI